MLLSSYAHCITCWKSPVKRKTQYCSTCARPVLILGTIPGQPAYDNMHAWVACPSCTCNPRLCTAHRQALLRTVKGSALHTQRLHTRYLQGVHDAATSHKLFTAKSRVTGSVLRSHQSQSQALYCTIILHSSTTRSHQSRAMQGTRTGSALHTHCHEASLSHPVVLLALVGP